MILSPSSSSRRVLSVIVIKSQYKFQKSKILWNKLLFPCCPSKSYKHYIRNTTKPNHTCIQNIQKLREKKPSMAWISPCKFNDWTWALLPLKLFVCTFSACKRNPAIPHLVLVYTNRGKPSRACKLITEVLSEDEVDLCLASTERKEKIR